MKKRIIIFMVIMVLMLTSCVSKTEVSIEETINDAVEVVPAVNINNVPWKVKMGINYLGDSAAMVEYTNNTEFTVSEVYLKFRMKNNIAEEKLEEFYSYLKVTYNLSEEDITKLRENGVSMSSQLYANEGWIAKGDKIEKSLLYGIKFIKTLEYYNLFEPEKYRITYFDENKQQHTTYYDYINNMYTEN